MTDKLLRNSALLLLLLVAFSGGLSAQSLRPEDEGSIGGDLFSAASPSPTPMLPPEGRKGTVVTATDTATFDNKSREATFVGNVKVVDPQFELTCDSMTAFLADESQKGDGGGSSLEKVIASGNVVVIQTRKSESGEPVVYTGKGERGVYNAVTGEFELTGWPEVQQGINRHVSTGADTVMIISRDGQMRTTGGSKTVIEERTDEQ